MKKVRICDIDGKTWEYEYDECNWVFHYDNNYLVVTRIHDGINVLWIMLNRLAYLEVVE